MILIPHCSHDYVIKNVDDKLAFGGKVHQRQVDNALIFGVQNVTPAMIDAANVALKNANDAYKLNPSLHGAVVNAERAWIKLFNQLSHNVDGIAHGDPNIIDLSGFNKTAAESHPTVAPVRPVVKDDYAQGKNGYHVQLIPEKKSSFMFCLCDVGAVLSASANQVSVDKGSLLIFSSTHPYADFAGVPSGDKQLVILAQNTLSLSLPSTPKIISIP